MALGYSYVFWSMFDCNVVYEKSVVIILRAFGPYCIEVLITLGLRFWGFLATRPLSGGSVSGSCAQHHHTGMSFLARGDEATGWGLSMLGSWQF